MSRRVAILCSVLLISFGLQLWLDASPAVPLRTPLARFPVALGGWELVREQTIEDRLLAVLQADDYLLRSYRNSEGKVIDLYIGYYGNQRTGKTIHSPKNCLPGWGWQPLESGQVSLATGLAEAPPVSINRYLVEKDGQRALVLYWYQAHGRIIASEYWGKIYLVWDSLRLRRRDGALVRLVLPVADDLQGAESRGLAFARLLLPELPRFLPD